MDKVFFVILFISMLVNIASFYLRLKNKIKNEDKSNIYLERINPIIVKYIDFNKKYNNLKKLAKKSPKL